MKRIPFLYRMIRGAIGKRFVVKHYPGGRAVMTRYPDMTGIVPSQKQKWRRGLFKKAVAYAQKIYASPALKEEKRRLLRRPKRLFQALMKEWFRLQKEKECYRQRRINGWQKTWQQSKSIIPLISSPQPTSEFPRSAKLVNIRTPERLNCHHRTPNLAPHIKPAPHRPVQSLTTLIRFNIKVDHAP